MWGDLGDYLRLVVMGAAWRLGERYAWLVVTVVGLWWCIRHAVGLATIGLGLYAWTQTGNPAVALALTFYAYALVGAVRLALIARAGTARGFRAILAGAIKKARLERKWPRIAAVSGLRTNADGQGAIAPLGAVRIAQHGLRAEIFHGDVGKDSRELAKASGSIKVQVNAMRARVVQIPGQTSRSLLVLDWGEHLRQTWTLADLYLRIIPEHPLPADAIPFGINEDGEPAWALWNLSKLIGALTRAGKSSLVWSYLAGLIHAGVPLRLWVFDPKMIEFAEMGRALGQGIVHRYVNDLQEMTSRESYQPGGIWYEIEHAMAESARVVASLGLRALTVEDLVTHGLHLNLVIVDEFMPLARDIQSKGNDHPLTRLAFMGGAMAWAALLLTQAGQLDVTGRVRDLVAERIALALPNVPSTDAVLGNGADSDGARCSELSLVDDKGVGYTTAGADRRSFVAFRAALTSDVENRSLARGVMPELVLPGAVDLEERVTHLYGHQLVNAWTNPDDGRTWPAGTWAYIGITTQTPQERWDQHRRDGAPWIPDSELVVFRTYARWSWARAAEDDAIDRLQPLYNDQGNHDNPNRIPWRQRRRLAGRP